jgi:hypothetical protein
MFKSTLAASVLAIAVAATSPSQPVAAASQLGTSYPASVTCNTLGNTVDITPTASAAPGLARQLIAYRYAIWDHTRNQKVIGWWPSTWGTFTHVYQETIQLATGGSTIVTSPTGSGPTTRLVLPTGSYSVQTQYAFLGTDGRWTYGSWVMTTRYVFYPVLHTALCRT